MTFQGLMTAIVTPFQRGALDEATHRTLVERQIEGGVQGLVPCGTTGEAPTLELDEHAAVIRWTVEQVAGRIPVMAGIGSNNTATAVSTAKRAVELGVQGVLATAPYYNKPTQEGLYQHFRAIALAVDTEVCLYDVPGRSVVRLNPETIERLAAFPNITAIKDATGDLPHLVEVRRRIGDRMALLSGDDFTQVPFMMLGGHGVISVASNIVPRRMRELVDHALQGRNQEARVLNERLFPLFKTLFMESNPGGAKAAMAAMGLLQDDLRLPMVPISTSREPLIKVLRSLELIR